MLPTKQTKVNQDSYIIVSNLCNTSGNWLYGVFDGHGVNGHLVSDYIKNALQSNIELIEQQQKPSSRKVGASPLISPTYSSSKEPLFIENDTPNGRYSNALNRGLASLEKKDVLDLLTMAFKKTSMGLAKQRVDINFSGSTAVTVFLIGTDLYCANIGDSRAVLASMKVSPTLKEYDGKYWVATPISRDHKPDDEFEMQRILKSGGRIDSFRDQLGNPIGPNRVWLKTENIPGLAMSRSFGDKVAASIGVSSEPEIVHKQLEKEDKFIIVASDGIWEFISNTEAVEIVVPYWVKNDPEGAVDHLINLATEKWKKEDEVIDDITCLIAFLSV
jgi:serine/threonine protein phosphatase PrpC